MDYMARALELARLALGTSSPNPSVGAVLVKDGVIVGEGFTQPPGQGHAEVVALRQAGERARGAAMYVTLEPCSHYGRTPPCSRAIIAAGVAEVHFPCIDPNPQVNGRGQAELEAAGVRCVVGEHHDEALRLVRAHAKWSTTRVPLVTAKFAMSLDGKTATRTGDSRWITGEAARARVHELRRTVDAVMVGVGTVLTDDPLLTARDAQGNPLPRQPLRVVVDSLARTPPTARLLAQPGRTLVAVASPDPQHVAALRRAGAEVAALPDAGGRVDPAALLRHLGAMDVTHVLVEGGGALLASLLEARLVDQVWAFVAPVLVGGKDAPTPVEGTGAARLADALRLGDVEVERLGDDLLVRGALTAMGCVHTRAAGRASPAGGPPLPQEGRL